MQVFAYVKDEKIIEIVERRTGGKRRERHPGDGLREVDITAQPWLKIGDYWGPDPTQWVKPPSA